VFGSGAKGKAFGEEVNLGLGEGDMDWLYSQRSLGLGVAVVGGVGGVGGLGVMRRANCFFWRSRVARWAESAWRRTWAVRLL
jgi:hypothetical protein